MPFKEFPADLALLLVSEYISPDDIEAFSLTCRGIHDLAESRLREYRELKAINSTINLEASVVWVGKEHWDKLYQCSSDAWTRLYPRHLHVLSCNVTPLHAIQKALKEKLRILASFSEFCTPAEVSNWDLKSYVGQ